VNINYFTPESIADHTTKDAIKEVQDILNSKGIDNKDIYFMHECDDCFCVKFIVDDIMHTNGFEKKGEHRKEWKKTLVKIEEKWRPLPSHWRDLKI